MSGLDHILGPSRHDDVWLDSTARDDAALVKVAGQLVACSVDFGTPISSDASVWGRIGALNALSDLYAIGAVSLFAMSLVGWPETLPFDLLTELTEGAVGELRSESTVLVGGHTISSAVPLFGLAVVGTARPEATILVGNAMPGQRLLLTKPLGTGIITAARKAHLASAEAVTASESVMLTSNRSASNLAVELGIRAGTDVTGNGLIGHLHNMLKASGVAADIDPTAVPFLPDAVKLMVEHGIVPNSAERNYLVLESHVDWSTADFAMKFLFSDPQTSGGLLLSADPARADEFVARGAQKGLSVAQIGQVRTGVPGSVRILPGRLQAGGA